jgi:hypothetical protein
LILFATLLFFAQGVFRRFAGLNPNRSDRAAHSRHVWSQLLSNLAFRVYGGYFGAGIGILMLASLGFLGLHDIHEMNALKNVLGSLINAVAAAWFVASGLIDWPKAGVMTGGCAGGLLHRRALFTTYCCGEVRSPHHSDRFHDLGGDVLPAVSGERAAVSGVLVRDQHLQQIPSERRPVENGPETLVAEHRLLRLLEGPLGHSEQKP